MDTKEKFLELLQSYPHSFSVNLKNTPYGDLQNPVITNPLERVHHVFLPRSGDPFKLELSAALLVLGERHHLLSTDYFCRETQENRYEFIEPFSRLARVVRYGWAGQVAAKHSPDPDRLAEEALKKIEIAYLDRLYGDDRRAALSVLPLVAFAKGIDGQWDFFSSDELNELLNDLMLAQPTVENLLTFVERFEPYLPCFCRVSKVMDQKRGFEVFSLIA